jgi:topoisomerase-4 subunit A
MIYSDGKSGKTFMKRFPVTSITRDKEYRIAKGDSKTKVHYFTANPNGEAEVVAVHLKHVQRLKKLRIDVDFADLAIKGRGAKGNLVTKHPVKKVEMKEEGVSTLGARKIWYDESIRRLNSDGRGRFLGDFQPDDKIIVLLDSGEYKIIGFDLSTHFEDHMTHLEKWVPEKPISAVYWDPEKEHHFVKRFLAEPSTKAVSFISDHEDAELDVVSTQFHPVVSIRFNKKFKITRDKEDEKVDLAEFISVKGLKAQGNRLTSLPVTEVNLEEPDQEREEKAWEKFKEEHLGSKGVEESEGEVEEEEEDDSPEETPTKGKKNGDDEETGQELGTPDDVSKPIELDVDSNPKKEEHSGVKRNKNNDSSQPTLFDE